MHALRLTTPKQPVEYVTTDKPEPQDDYTLVKVAAAALNHRDVYITQGLYPGVEAPVTLGSDGVGTTPDGKRVLIDPGMEWGDNEAYQSDEYHILGMPTDGTFAEYVKVPTAQLHPVPPHLSDTEAAALPLAGATAYRAVFTKCGLQSGERVLISGIGGGVALMAFQLALAAGAEVWVTSGSDAKLDRARELGASGGANYRHDDWYKTLLKATGGFDVIIDSAGGDGFAHFAKLAKPGARIAFYGGTQGKINGLSPQLLFWRQVSIYGTTMGSPSDFDAMLDFVTRHEVTPVVDEVYPLSEGMAAFDRMAAGDQFGKIVLQVG